MSTSGTYASDRRPRQSTWCARGGPGQAIDVGHYRVSTPHFHIDRDRRPALLSADVAMCENLVTASVLFSVHSARGGVWFLEEASYRLAVRDLFDAMHGNSWFLSEFWPLYESHVRLMLDDLRVHRSPSESRHVLDVGCFNGYISFLVRRMGYQVTGTDIHDLEQRRTLFEENGIGYVSANFNSLTPFPEIGDESFDAVILTQVIEHVLNCPLGFMTELARITKPGGLLVITTPQPASVMNAFRLLLGRGSIWGTEEFICQPKIRNGDIISYEGIHYGEYFARELCSMVEDTGYEVLKHRYIGLGATEEQPSWKRLLKASPPMKWLMTNRLFASNQYVLARKRTA